MGTENINELNTVLAIITIVGTILSILGAIYSTCKSIVKKAEEKGKTDGRFEMLATQMETHNKEFNEHKTYIGKRIGDTKENLEKEINIIKDELDAKNENVQQTFYPLA